MQTPRHPYGTTEVDGVVHHASPLGVAATVERVTGLVREAGATVFAVVDQRDAAAGAGLTLRETTLVLFGHPSAGTPVMRAVPLAALDLPLKVLVWADEAGSVWVSHLSGEWLAHRWGVPPDLAGALGAAEALAATATAT